MKVLLINKFLYPKGGDAVYTLNLGGLLATKGHKVIFWGMKHHQNFVYRWEEYFVSHVDYNERHGMFKNLELGLHFLYSLEAKRKIDRFIRMQKPDLIHLNNISGYISPSILDVFAEYNIPTVMTIHDYKLVCPVYQLFRRGKICEDCRHGRYFYCIINKCCKNSYIKSLVNTIEMYFHHKILHIYDLIDIYISPSMFLKQKLRENGFYKNIEYLPIFVDVDNYVPMYNWGERTIVYFGRLSSEKGLITLTNAVKGLDVKLKILGDGPLRDCLLQKVKDEKINNVSFLGYKTGKELKKEIQDAMAVVIPSEYYENSPLSILEAFALGKPVVGARIGGISEMVKDNFNGLTFEPCNSIDLKEKILAILDNPNKLIEMGKNAREYVEQNHNPEEYYYRLMEIYNMVIARKGKPSYKHAV